MNSLFIIDASGYLYRSYFAIRNMTNAKGQSTNALFGFIRSIQKLIKDFGPEYLVAVFDGPNNGQTRKEIYPEYKAHRSSMPQDLLYQMEWARTFCEKFGIPYLYLSGVEADDTMGSIAKSMQGHFEKIYLCTSDKDMCQMVNDKVVMLNTHKDNQILTPLEVKENFGVSPSLIVDLLALIGDASDNIPGVSGIGPKTAAQLLGEFGSLDNLLKNLDKVSGKKQQVLHDETDKAILSRQLATINTEVAIPKELTFYQLIAPEPTHLQEFYLEMNFKSLLKEMETQENPTSLEKESVKEAVSYHLVDDQPSFQALLTKLQNQPYVCFDTETTDIHPLNAELVGIGFGFAPKEAWYVPLNGQLDINYALEHLKLLFENPKIGFYGHNVKYDYHILKNYGIEVANLAFDTILASYLLNSHSRQHSLDLLSLEYFGKTKISIESLIGKGKSQISMADVPLEKICEYCCEDVDYTCRLKLLLEDQLKERKLLELFQDLEMPLMRVLAEMERKGIFLDVPYTEILSKELSKKIVSLQEEIFAMAGETFNLNSPKQLTAILTEKLGIRLPKKTATGFSTNAEILESLKRDYPICGKILEYRTVEKLRSTYVDALPTQVNPHTKRIHCTFNQSVTATGRLSCQNPNLQNIPIRTEVGRKIRVAFRPEKPGWSYLSADYSQIELRLLAHLCQDPTLVYAFNENEDIHVHTASRIFNVPLSSVTQDMRYQAKAVNFGIIYGQQAYGLSEQIGVSVKEAARFIETYFQRYPAVKGFLEACKAKARESEKAVTLYGRERAIPEINSKNVQIRQLAERLAVNTPIQGTAADLIKKAMLEIEEQIERTGKKSYMILQIHDELIFEVPDEEIEEMKELVRKTMQNVESLKIPLIVDIHIGKNWEEC